MQSHESSYRLPQTSPAYLVALEWLQGGVWGRAMLHRGAGVWHGTAHGGHALQHRVEYDIWFLELGCQRLSSGHRYPLPRRTAQAYGPLMFLVVVGVVDGVSSVLLLGRPQGGGCTIGWPQELEVMSE